MDSYKVVFKPSVEKDLKVLSKASVLRVTRRIGALASDPFPQHAIKLSGADRLYRVRVGDYRIVYEVDTKGRQVTIHYVRQTRSLSCSVT
jgi:mRNA interferase RelE/StbE